jgi:hypothetical protein
VTKGLQYVVFRDWVYIFQETDQSYELMMRKVEKHQYFSKEDCKALTLPFWKAMVQDENSLWKSYHDTFLQDLREVKQAIVSSRPNYEQDAKISTVVEKKGIQTILSGENLSKAEITDSLFAQSKLLINHITVNYNRTNEELKVKCGVALDYVTYLRASMTETNCDWEKVWNRLRLRTKKDRDGLMQVLIKTENRRWINNIRNVFIALALLLFLYYAVGFILNKYDNFN